MAETADRQPSRQGTFLAWLTAEGKPFLRLCWGAFWKANVLTTAGAFLLFVIASYDDFRGDFPVPRARTVIGVAAVFGYCLVLGACTGVAALVFTVAWRFWRAWIFLPLLGAVVGAVGSVGFGILLLEWLHFAPAAGVHGGGQIAATLLFAVAAMVAALGAGGICGVLLAVALRR